MLAHEMEYVATATPYYWKDMLTKVRKGLEVEGPAFLHIFAPCPRGWRTEPAKTMEYSKLSVESCVFPIWEAVNGKRQLSTPSKLIASGTTKEESQSKTTLAGQGRFRHLFTPQNQHVSMKCKLTMKWQRLSKCEQPKLFFLLFLKLMLFSNFSIIQKFQLLIHVQSDSA